MGLFSAACEVVESGGGGVGGFSSAPIVLERDDLIGKCFTDPTPPS